MPTTQGNKKVLDPKRWEFMTPALEAQKSASFAEGNLQDVVSLDVEIIETKQTIKELE